MPLLRLLEKELERTQGNLLLVYIAMVSKSSSQVVKAIVSGELSQIKGMVDAGLDLNMTINSTGTSILCFAVQENKPEIVSHLLSLGANPDYGGLKSVTTPLIEALHRYEPKLVRILLKAGANPNFVPEGSFFTPLIKASLDLDGYLVRQLLDFGVDVNQKNSYGSTALMSAVFTATRKNLLYRESKAVQRMLEAGAIGEGILESQWLCCMNPKKSD